MSSPSFTDSPAWVLQPTSVKNVIRNQFSSLKEVPTFVNVPDYSLFYSGLKQALFWRRQLAPSATSNTVILSLLGQQGLILPNALELCQALKSICNMLNVVEFYRASNSAFIGISFNNSQDAAKVRSYFSYYQNAIVIHVSPVSSLTHHFKLLWLPPLFPDSRIHHFLAKHSVHHNFIRDSVLTDTDTRTPSNSVSGTLELSPTYDIAKLPHLIPLPSPHLGSALLILSGRPSLCLKCGQTGHIRRSCSSPKCAVCHRFHPSHLPCSSSDTSLSSPFTPWLDDDPASDSISASSPSPHISVSECILTSDTSPITSLHEPAPTTLSGDTSNISSQDIRHAYSSLPLTTTLNSLHNTTDSTDFASLNVKRITRSMSSSKRTFNSTSQCITSPSALSISHSNIYNTLTDEADAMPNDFSSNASTIHPSLLTEDLSSTIKEVAHSSTAMHATESDPLAISTKITHSISGSSHVPNTDSEDNSLTIQSCKRVKLSTAKLSSSSPSTSDPALPTPSLSWAEQTEMDLGLQVDISSIPSSSTASLPSSHSETIIALEHSSNYDSNNPSAAPSAYSSDPDTCSDDQDSIHSSASSVSISTVVDLDIDLSQHVYITGFPINTHRSSVASHLGSIAPIALWHIMGPDDSYVGNFGATFSSPEEASKALAKNRQQYDKSKIYIQRFKNVERD